MSGRGDRRSRTSNVVARRAKLSKTFGNPERAPHRYHKDDPLGHCGSPHCTICTAERVDKQLTKKRERAARKKVETDD